jgi:hypothetical protein
MSAGAARAACGPCSSPAISSRRISRPHEDQLAHLTAELARSRAPLLEEPLTAAAVEWSTALTAASLPEAQP